MQKKGEFIVPLISPLCYLSLSKEQKVDKVHFKVQVRFADVHTLSSSSSCCPRDVIDVSWAIFSRCTLSSTRRHRHCVVVLGATWWVVAVVVLVSTYKKGVSNEETKRKKHTFPHPHLLVHTLSPSLLSLCHHVGWNAVDSYCSSFSKYLKKRCQ